MRKITICIFGSLLFITCKKNNDNTNAVGQTALVKSITHKTHKIDSSGRFYTKIDSFLYDNQSRVSTYFNLVYDTTFVLDNNGNVISASPNFTINTYSLNYTGSSLIPNSINSQGGISYISLNNAGQIISDSSSPFVPVTHYTYFNNLIVGITNQGTFYNIDSITIDVNSNMTSNILGGNYSLNNSYGRIALWNDTYSNIPNPIYLNKSASSILFLTTNVIQSKNICAKMEWVSYGQSSTIIRSEVSTFQNIVDSNNLIQSSLNLNYGDFTKWSYY